MAEAGDVYRRFIATAARVGHAALENRSKRAVREHRQDLHRLLDDVIRELVTHTAVEEIERAWRDLSPNVAGLLQRELSLIASIHENDTDGGGVEDVKTGKESIEDILSGLPDWVKHLLKILNEILKLAVGGG